MDKPTEAVYADERWNDRERRLFELFLEYYSIPHLDDIDEQNESGPDKLAQTLTNFLKGNK